MYFLLQGCQDIESLFVRRLKLPFYTETHYGYVLLHVWILTGLCATGKRRLVFDMHLDTLFQRIPNVVLRLDVIAVEFRHSEFLQDLLLDLGLYFSQLVRIADADLPFIQNLIEVKPGELLERVCDVWRDVLLGTWNDDFQEVTAAGRLLGYRILDTTRCVYLRKVQPESLLLLVLVHQKLFVIV